MPMRLVAVAVLATLLFTAAVPAAAQTTPSRGSSAGTTRGVGPAADPLDGLDAYVARAVRDWEVPGFAIAVVRNGRMVFAKGYGVREMGRHAPVDEHTLFAIASTTKAFTAASIGMLVDDGKLRWDDPVVRHLPWFQLGDPFTTSQVTVRDLLTHRAGVGNADYLWYEQEGTPRDIIERLRLAEPAYSLRDGFVYQNVMYATAGEVVAAVSGMSWNDFVRTRLLRPLGMTRTVTTLGETKTATNVASPHDQVNDTLRVITNSGIDNAPAAGAMWSSVHDMARWLAFLQRGCVTESGQALLRERTCEELFRPQTIQHGASSPILRLVKPSWTTYGLGWFQLDYAGRKVDYHTGSLDGMVAIAGLVRADSVGVYMLGNRDHAELRHALMYRVFDLSRGEATRDWSAELKAVYDSAEVRQDSIGRTAPSRRAMGTSPSLPLEKYVGSYSDPLRGTVVVTMQNGALRATYGLRSATLEHWAYDTFRGPWDTAWRGTATLQFIVDPDGTTSRVEFMGTTMRRERERTPPR